MIIRKPDVGYEKWGKKSSTLGSHQAYEKRIEILLAVKWTKVEIHTSLWKSNESSVAAMCTRGETNA